MRFVTLRLIDAPVRPTPGQRARLQSSIGVDRGCAQRGECLVVLDQSGHALPSQIAHAVGIGIVGQGRVTVCVLQAEVDVDSRAGNVGEGFAKEREVEASLDRQLADHRAEDKGVVGGCHGVVVAQGELELRLVELDVGGLDQEATVMGGEQHLVEETGRIAEQAGSVDH